MFASTKIGRFFGINFYVHGTFWLLPLLILFGGLTSGDSLFEVSLNIAIILAVFGCVALHEIGHALAARYYGIATRDITLYPIGGVARLENMPHKPWQEIAIALAGPAVNLVIALGLIAGLLGAGFALPRAWSDGNSVGELVLGQLLYANLMLFGFNLIPAFPMDGGRVLRAFLTMPLGRLRATEIAASVGAVVAVIFFVWGLLSTPIQLMFMVLAVVLYLLGKAELAAVRFQDAKARWQDKIGDLFGHQAPGPAYDQTSGDAFSGWKWDPARKVWTEWRDGYPIREVGAV